MNELRNVLVKLAEESWWDRTKNLFGKTPEDPNKDFVKNTPAIGPRGQAKQNAEFVAKNANRKVKEWNNMRQGLTAEGISTGSNKPNISPNNYKMWAGGDTKFNNIG